jgi:hypothetical protein
VKRRRPEDGRQEDRRQKTEDRRQKTEDREGEWGSTARMKMIEVRIWIAQITSRFRR